MMNLEPDNSLLDVFKALANKPRMKIVGALSETEKNVGELGTITGLSQSAVSQHLSRLRSSGLVKTRREAQTVYYMLDKEIVRPVMNYFSKITKGNAS